MDVKWIAITPVFSEIRGTRTCNVYQALSPPLEWPGYEAILKQI